MLVAWTALAVVGSLLTPPRCGVVSMGGSNSKGGAKKKPASSGGGFGAAPPPPPTLDEVCASFPQRLPKDTSVSCPCGSGESYADCCRPYHVGEKTPQTPETCLRVRYSGFCYRLPKFIIESTDMSNADWQRDRIKWARRLSREQMFDSFKFIGLEVGDVEPGANDKEVAFGFFLCFPLFPTRDTPISPRSHPIIF